MQLASDGANVSAELLNPAHEEFTFRVQILEPTTNVQTGLVELKAVLTTTIETESWGLTPVYRDEEEEMRLLHKRVHKERRPQQGDLIQLKHNKIDSSSSRSGYDTTHEWHNCKGYVEETIIHLPTGHVTSIVFRVTDVREAGVPVKGRNYRG